MANCRFKTDIIHRDENTGGYVQYVCREPEENILDSGLCIFHSGEYLKDPKNIEANKQNIKAKLTEKIEKSEPLICIGYHLPEFSFKRLHFDKSVDFSDSVFAGVANFEDAQFTEAIFNGAQFTEAIFEDAQFTGKASFKDAQFTGKAYFNRAQFTEADFYGLNLQEKPISIRSSIYRKSLFQ